MIGEFYVDDDDDEVSYNDAWLDGYKYCLKELKDFIETNKYSDDEIVSILNFIEEKSKCHNK
jgi:hypothetical protein